jgi:hypothetical protein
MKRRLYMTAHDLVLDIAELEGDAPDPSNQRTKIWRYVFQLPRYKAERDRAFHAKWKAKSIMVKRPIRD